MCIDADQFLMLSELYPQTANDLKIRSLEKRQFFMEQFKQSENLRRFKNTPGMARAFKDDLEFVDEF